VNAQLFIIIGWVARHRWQIVLFAGLLGLAVLILAFAHAWDTALPYAAPRAKCFETFWGAPWPKWIGCAMAAHESLAAGLIGLWAAILAASLAYSAIQTQIAEERRNVQTQIAEERRNIEMQIAEERRNVQTQITEERRNIQMQIEEERQKAALMQAQAKAAAAIAITQVIYAAAATLFAVKQAQMAQDQQQIAHWDDRINQGVSYIGDNLNHFSVREFVRDLGGRDRLIYLGIVGQLTSFVMINKHPSQHLDRATRLDRQHFALMKLRELLAAFDSDLAAVYDRDSGIAGQS
jgi:hypothetical protein